MKLIQNLTEDFFNATIAQEEPGGLCFTVAYPLCLHLINNGIDCTLNVGKCEGRAHFWVQLNDDAKTIIDITIKQFEFASEHPSIFIDKLPSVYTVENSIDDWFKNSYDTWLAPIYMPSAYQDGPCKLDFDRLYRVNIKSAIFLLNDERQINFNETDFVKQYLFGVFEMIRLMGKENRERHSRISGFETLSKKAVQYYKAQESSRNS